MVFIGLSGWSSHSSVYAPGPSGAAHLETDALNLYERFTAALDNAVRHGKSDEDRSRGYALSADPKTHAIQLAIRRYALNHGPEIEKVLQTSGDVEQRRASAYFLGYAKRSAAQVRSLVGGARDVDEEVRNNAVRSLAVLASAQDGSPVKIDPQIFIQMLFSGKWTDRNKGSLLLEQLSKQRDPELLHQLRTEALRPLIEGARWENPGHSFAFLMILGRAAGIPEPRLEELVSAGDKDGIILAAER